MNENKKNNSIKNFNPYWGWIITGAVLLAFYFFSDSASSQKTEWRDVREMLENGYVEKAEVITNRNRVDIYLNEKGKNASKDKLEKNKNASPEWYFNIYKEWKSFDEFKAAQENIPVEKRIEPSYKEESDVWGGILSWIFPIALIIILWMFIMRGMTRGSGGGSGGIFSVGKSKAQLFDKNSAGNKITFNDVAGLEEAKVEIKEIVDFLKNPAKYTALGGKIPKGALLVGPPGTGKTLLAKAVAGEANVPFFSMSGSDFVEMFVGVGASRVRDLFKQAKEKAPCIVFIDEIDAVGRARGKNVGWSSNDERENTLNQLLTEMDGFGTNSGVIILAATNRADILDKALMRAGRFDRQIHVDLPELRERQEIFQVHLRGIKLIAGLDISFLAKQTPGFSGADIANVCNEAALIAARNNKNAVDRQDFLDAIDRIIAGLEKKSKIISIEEKRTIAYHEAGHATVSWLLEHANPLLKVTIIPRGRSLGAAWYLPEERQITTTEQMMDEMSSALGGRASEELTFAKISTGAISDLEKVTKQAYAMVAYFGMSEKIGNMSYYDSSGQDMMFAKPYSEKTAELLDSEAKKIIDNAYKLAKKVLTEHSEGLKQVAELLLEKEVIFSEDLERILGRRKSMARLEELGFKPISDGQLFIDDEK